MVLNRIFFCGVVSSVSFILKYRCGRLKSLGAEEIQPLRVAMDTTYMNTANAVYGMSFVSTFQITCLGPFFSSLISVAHGFGKRHGGRWSLVLPFIQRFDLSLLVGLFATANAYYIGVGHRAHGHHRSEDDHDNLL